MVGVVQSAAAAAEIIVDAMEEKGLTNKMLAVRTGLSVGCISALRNGRTRWPRDTTMFIVLEVLDLRMEIRRKGNR